MAKPQAKSETRTKLIDAARQAKLSAYAPYSRFHVGAAVLLDDDSIVTGSNVENASYGLTCCAERVALFSAIGKSKGDPSRLKALALSCGDDPDLPPNALMPCGACRQVMVELLSPNAPVYIDGAEDTTVSDLMPTPFKISPP